jgi:hypothetical protein
MPEFDGFELRFNGAYHCLDGPARRGGATAYCNKKLCFTARRQDLLARHLRRLAEREDCFFVKFGARARDGMYLGRCFLLTDAAVGEVWAQYKGHPSLFCTVQDDDFTTAYRQRCDVYDGVWVNEDEMRLPTSASDGSVTAVR